MTSGMLKYQYYFIAIFSFKCLIKEKVSFILPLKVKIRLGIRWVNTGENLETSGCCPQ